MKTQILRMLRNSPDYVSGQELCEELGVSRTAVWKSMNKLKEEGYEIEAVQNRGYHLISCPDVVTGSEVGSRLSTSWAGRKILHYKETDSTNNQAKREAEAAEHGTLIIADIQSAGKGRRGRSWSSPAGTGIFMSLILKPVLRPAYASMLTLVAALSTARAIEETAGLEAKIKWPNDLVVNKKKVTGILTELSAEMEQIHYIVIGIGINVNTENMPDDIASTATSLRIESGRQLSRAALIACFLNYFEKDYESFLSSCDLSSLMEEYNKRLINRGSMVRVLDPEEEYEGKALGINEKGGLMVQRGDQLEIITSGEVSVRGVYGYV